MHDEITSLGATLVAISPQLPEKSAEVKAKHRLAFPVLGDAGNAYAASLGLVHGFPEDLRAVYEAQFEASMAHLPLLRHLRINAGAEGTSCLRVLTDASPSIVKKSMSFCLATDRRETGMSVIARLT